MKKFLESRSRKPVMWLVALTSFAVFGLLCIQIGKEVFPFGLPTPSRPRQVLVAFGGLVDFAFLWISFASIVVAQKGKLRQESSTSESDLCLRETIGLVFFATFVCSMLAAFVFLETAKLGWSYWSWIVTKIFLVILAFFSLLFLPGSLGCDLRGGPRARSGTPGRHGYSIPALRGRFWIDTNGPHRDCQCAECLKTFHGVPQY